MNQWHRKSIAIIINGEKNCPKSQTRPRNRFQGWKNRRKWNDFELSGRSSLSIFHLSNTSQFSSAEQICFFLQQCFSNSASHHLYNKSLIRSPRKVNAEFQLQNTHVSSRQGDSFTVYFPQHHAWVFLSFTL